MISKATLALTALLALGPVVAGAAPQKTQSFDLHPGWNAVFLEVEPQANDVPTALAGVPFLSAWTWNPRLSPVDFISDPSEGLFNKPGWLGHFASGPEAATNNLFTFEANRAYLIHLGGGSNVTWTVTGRPSAPRREWVANSFNLVGLHVDPAGSPSFAQFFAGSPAHAGQAIYRLDVAGTWQPIPASTTIQSGEAYWIYCTGGSSYLGPLEVKVEQGDDLDYSQSIDEFELKVKNVAATAATVSIELQSSGSPLPLAYWTLDPVTNQIAWPALAGALSVPVGGKSDFPVRLAVVRADLSGDFGEGVLEIKDGRGSRYWVPARAERLGAPQTSFSLRGGNSLRTGRSSSFSASAVLPPYAGLWVGDVTVTKVSRSQYIVTPSVDSDPAQWVAVQGTSLTPIPVQSEFTFRVLIHVDESGSVRLLRDAIQMWQDGTGGAAGRYVLVTDQSRIGEFTGATLRDGDPVGRRVSSAAYDFPATAPDYGQALTGSLGPTGSLSATFTIDKDHPTNPFRHKFHPDHDNQGPLGPVNDAWDVTRTMTFTFSSTDPTGHNPPGWGSSVLGGTFTDAFDAGSLHKNPIATSGTFRLKRVSLVAQLNQ